MSETNNAAPYGKDLAERVATHLVKHRSICVNTHRDYCGVAFSYQHGMFIYDYVYDGLFEISENPNPDYPPPIRTFGSRAEFVAWLAKQSDESLSGRDTGDPFLINNQRITRARLERELRTAEKK
ncbi:MAG: hypothetical protein OHK0022_36010 [Roseiflexaceae bacterium]